MFTGTGPRQKPVKAATVWWYIALALFLIGVLVIVSCDFVTPYTPAATDLHNILVVIGIVLIFAAGVAVYVAELCSSLSEESGSEQD